MGEAKDSHEIFYPQSLYHFSGLRKTRPVNIARRVNLVFTPYFVSVYRKNETTGSNDFERFEDSDESNGRRDRKFVVASRLRCSVSFRFRPTLYESRVKWFSVEKINGWREKKKI